MVEMEKVLVLGITTDLCNFMFPGVSDPDFPGQEWSEVTILVINHHRRFIQSNKKNFTIRTWSRKYNNYWSVWANNIFRRK